MKSDKSSLAKSDFPRSSKYDPLWIAQNQMGPHVLWLAEYLCETLYLRPGMRVLDLGCGKAISSIFLTKEYDVEVVAADFWISPEDNQRRIDAAGVGEKVKAVFAEAHALPFGEGEFDAIISLDAYHYFGTDDLYLSTPAKLLKPGGQLGIVVPGVAFEIMRPPKELEPWWQWDFCSFHSPQWWSHHWAKTGLLTVQSADWMKDAHALWLEWCDFCAAQLDERGQASRREGDMLRADRQELLGFVRVIGRKE